VRKATTAYEHGAGARPECEGEAADERLGLTGAARELVHPSCGQERPHECDLKRTADLAKCVQNSGGDPAAVDGSGGEDSRAERGRQRRAYSGDQKPGEDIGVRRGHLVAVSRAACAARLCWIAAMAV
jgi:hypothetical protein